MFKAHNFIPQTHLFYIEKTDTAFILWRKEWYPAELLYHFEIERGCKKVRFAILNWHQKQLRQIQFWDWILEQHSEDGRGSQDLSYYCHLKLLNFRLVVSKEPFILYMADNLSYLWNRLGIKIRSPEVAYSASHIWMTVPSPLPPSKSPLETSRVHENTNQHSL